MITKKIIIASIFSLPPFLIFAQNECVVNAKRNNNQSIQSKYYVAISTQYGCHTFSEKLFINPYHPFEFCSGIKLGKNMKGRHRESFSIQSGILFFGINHNLIPVINENYFLSPFKIYRNIEIPLEIKFLMAEPKDKISAYMIGGIYNNIVFKQLSPYEDGDKFVPFKRKTQMIYNTLYLSIGLGFNVIISKNIAAYIEPIYKYSVREILGKTEYLTYRDQFGLGAGLTYYFTLNDH